MTRPFRIMPGIPTVTRSKSGIFAAMRLRVLTNRSGGSGYGVLMRTRSATISPSASGTDPLIPEPPQSIPRVITPSAPDVTWTACPMGAPHP